MFKLILFLMVYCIGFFDGCFSSDVNGIGSSIYFPVASTSGIENPKSFSNDRAKGRALALLVPFDDYDVSGEEHHKSKRCWRTRPVQKRRLSFEPKDTSENKINRESGRLQAQSKKYNFNKLYENEKRSAEQSDEESWENTQGWEDDLERKFPHLKIVPLKNPRINFKEFLRTDQQAEDDSEENTDDIILRKIKNHLNSDDYKVLALVGKRASYPKSDKQTKYICYCREANCSGRNCQQMMYRPCSRCKNSRPVFIGKSNTNRFSYGDKHCYKDQGVQSIDAITPLNIQYPATKKEVVEYPASENAQLVENPGIYSSANGGVDKMHYKNSQHDLPAGEDRRYQFSYNTPRVVLAQPNNIIKPLDQYRVVHLPIPTKSVLETETGIQNSNIPTNFHSSDPGKLATNEYRFENVKFRPNHSPYNQWIANSYYPSIGKADNMEIQNKNHRTDTQNFNKLYHNHNGFIGPNVPYANQGIVVFPQPRTQEMTTNFDSVSNNAFHHKLHDGNSFDSNIPDGIRTQDHPPQLHIQAPVGNPNYEKAPDSLPTQVAAELYGKKNQRIESSEEKNSQLDFKAGGFDESEKNHFDSATSSETSDYSHSDESQENNSKNIDYEDGTREKIHNSEASVGRSLAHSEDQRKIDFIGVSDEPEKYKSLINSPEEVNHSEINYLSDTLGAYENLESKNGEILAGCAENPTQETRGLCINKNSIISVNTTNHPITDTKISNYDDQTNYTIDETTFATQLEEPVNRHSNWDQFNDDTTSQAIIQPDSNEDGYSLISEPQDYSQSITTEPKHFDVKEPDQVLLQQSPEDDYSDIQVITNGYFTSQAYDDFEEINNKDIPVTVIASGPDFTQRAVSLHNSNSNYIKTNTIESALQNENVAKTDDEAITVDYIEDRKFDLPSIHPSGYEDLDESSMIPKNLDLDKNLDDDMTGISSTNDESPSNKPNAGCTCMQSNEVIETLKKPEISSIEVVGRQSTGSMKYESVTSDAEDNYKVDLSSGEVVQISNEEKAKQSADDLPSEESYEDVSSSENDSMKYSTEDSPAVFSQKKSSSPGDELVKTNNNEELREHENHKYYERVGDEPADFMIDNLPTKYFSPNDRVLEYIKQHSQNSLRYSDPGDYEQQRTQSAPIYQTVSGKETQYVTPTIYHTKIDRDESSESYSQEFDSGSESEEIIGQLSPDGNDQLDNKSGNFNERTALDIDASKEIPIKVDKSLIQDPRYEERNDKQLSSYGRHNAERQSIGFKKMGDVNTVEKSEKFQQPIDKSNIAEPSQTLTTNLAPEDNVRSLDYSEEYSPTVDVREDDYIYHDNISEDLDGYSEEFRDSEEKKTSEESGSILKHGDNLVADKIGTNYDSKKIIVDSPISSETYKNGGQKIHHLKISKSDPTETSHEIDSGEEDYSSIEPIRESALKHTPINISGDYYYSEKSTEGSILVGSSQEQDVDSTEGLRSAEVSIESSAVHNGAENLSANKKTQYNEQDDAESAWKTTSSSSHRVVVQQSAEESFEKQKKPLDNFGSSNDNVNSFGTEKERTFDYGQINNLENSSPELGSEINNFKKTTLNQYSEIKKHETQSTTKNFKSDDAVDQPELVLQHAVESEEENYSDIPAYDKTEYNPDVERHSEVHDTSTSEILSQPDSSGIKKSTGCCTKPSEVQDDSVYLGRLALRNSNPDVKSVSDLADSDLYYIGDGVKLPLTIKKLKDGSFALSISEKICEKRLEEKCPCCVPREGRILQEKRGEEDGEESTGKNHSSSLHRRAIPDDEESDIEKLEIGDSKTLDLRQHEGIRSPELNIDKKIQGDIKRVSRSISMPVDEFAEKYNLILNLNDLLANDRGDFGEAESSLGHNVIQRDEVKDKTRRDNSDLLKKLVMIDEVPVSERKGVLLSSLHDLIATESKDIFKSVNGMEEELQAMKSVEDLDDKGQKTRYGYQRDNPILDRIKIIKQLQKEVNRCEHKYQKDCDDAITQKTELLTMILSWLKDLVLSKPN